MNVFDLAAKISLDSKDFDSGLNKSESKFSKFGSAVSGGVKAVGGAVVKMGAAVGTALAAGATGVAALAKQSVTAYADYEQLVGGVETLFSNLEGTVSAAPQVLENANKAYKTAGLSANEYMETVTGFSAALIAGLNNDYDEAARVSDMAITDMADNANKMGTAMESIQTAYAGFAKQNYTMLDNLKLGYGGTKGEMERLLADAEKISGVHYDISNLADVYEAIHVIQGEIGITGTTAREAEQTITGSIAMTKSAFQNFIAGLANGDADIGSLIDELVSSAETALSNIIPAAGRAINGIATAVQKLAPVLSDKLPKIIQSVLPSLLSAASTLIQSVVSALPGLLEIVAREAPKVIMTLVTALLSQIPLVLQAAFQIITSLVSALMSNVDEILDAALQIIDTLVSGLTENLPKIIEMAEIIIVKLATGLAEYLPKLIPMAVNLVLSLANAIVSHLDLILDAALKLIMGLAQGIITALPVLLEQAPVIIQKLISTILSKLPDVIKCAGEIIKGLLTGILQALPDLLEEIPTLVISIVDTLLDLVPMIIDVGTELLSVLLDNSDAIIGTWADELPNLITGLVESIMSHLPAIIKAGYNLLKALFTKIPEVLSFYINFAFPHFWNKIFDWFGSLGDRMMNIGKELLSRLIGAWLKGANNIRMGVVNIWNNIKETFGSLLGKAANWGKDLIDNFVSGIKKKVQKVKDAVNTVASTIKRILGFSEPEEGPLSNFHTYAPDMIDLWNKGIEQNSRKLQNTIEGAFDFGPTIKASSGGLTKQTVTGAGNYSGMADAIVEALSRAPLVVTIDGKKTVGYLAPEINAQLGRINTLDGRGLCLG